MCIIADGTLRWAKPLAELTDPTGETLEAAFLRLTSTSTTSTTSSITGVQAASDRA